MKKQLMDSQIEIRQKVSNYINSLFPHIRDKTCFYIEQKESVYFKGKIKETIYVIDDIFIFRYDYDDYMKSKIRISCHIHMGDLSKVFNKIICLNDIIIKVKHI